MNEREATIKLIAQALVHRHGFGWYDDPMEGGQDAYDICLDALEDAMVAFDVIKERITT